MRNTTPEITSLDKAIEAVSSGWDSANTELASVLVYDGKVMGRCIPDPDTHEQRKARREADIAGSKDALAIPERATASVV